MTLSSNLGFGFDASTATPTANRIPQADGSGKIAVGWVPDMIGADGFVDGTDGLVPQPLAVDNVKFLRGDGTWATVTSGVSSVNTRTGAVTLLGTDIPAFIASGGSHAPGAVPDPGSSSGTTKFLREDATWVVPVTAVNTRTGSVTLLGTDIPAFVASGGSHAPGAVPDPGSSAGTTKFLREDATWVVPVTSVNTRTGAVVLIGTDIPTFVASGGSHAAGAVPDPGSSAGSTRFLCEDATWTAPTGGAVSSVNTRTGAVVLVGTDIPVFVASGGSHAVGAVPDPGSSAGTTKFLREDATWVVPSGGGGSSVVVQTKSSSVTSGATTTSSSYADTGFSITLANTLGSSSNVVRVSFTFCTTSTGPGAVGSNISFIIKRANTTDLTPSGGTSLATITTANANYSQSVSITIDDLPATTTPQSYNLWWKITIPGPPATASLNGSGSSFTPTMTMIATELTP